MKMKQLAKKVIIPVLVPILALMGMSGCATLSSTTPVTLTQEQQMYSNTCDEYNTALSLVLVFGEHGYLTKPDIQQVNMIDETITPLCNTGVFPANMVTATQQITTALTQLAVYEGTALAAAKQTNGATIK